MRLRPRFLLAVALPLLGLLGVLLAVEHASLKRSALGEADARALAEAGRVAREVELRLRGPALAARFLAGAAEALALVPTDAALAALDVPEIDPLVARVVLAAPPEAGGVALPVPPAGAAAPGPVAARVFERAGPAQPWRVARAVGPAPDAPEARWSEPYVDASLGLVVSYSAGAGPAGPAGRGGRGGVARVDVRVDALARAVLGPHEPQHPRVVVIGRSARVVFDRHDARADHVATLVDALGRSGDAALLAQDMAAGRREARRIRLAGAANDQDALRAGFAPVPGLGWSAAVLIDESAVLAPVRAAILDRALNGLLAIAVTLLVVALAGAYLARPLRHLRRSVRDLAASGLGGDATGRADEAGGGSAAPGLARPDAASHDAARRHAGHDADALGPIDQLMAAARRRDEVGELAAAIGTMVGRVRDRLDGPPGSDELRVARSLQRALLPAPLPPGRAAEPGSAGAAESGGAFELAARCAPAQSVGGDHYDYFMLGPDHLAIVVADVAGKGVAAAMFAAVSRTVMRDLLLAGHAPDQALALANERLVDANPESLFVTMFVADYHPATGRLRYANAAHPRPVRIGADGRAELFGDLTGTVVGAVPGLSFEQRGVDLAVGETLVIYTDGVSEARAADGSFFGVPRLLERLHATQGRPAEGLVDDLIAAVDAFQAGERHDDVTLLVLRRRA